MCERALALRAFLACVVSVAAPLRAQEADYQANAEVFNLTQQFGLPVIQLGVGAGNYTLSAAQSLTAASLPQAVIQNGAPQLGSAPAFPITQQDGVVTPPYVSTGLGNFGFDWFNNVYVFFGYYTWSTEDYAALHGFNALGSSYRDATTDSWEPAGTQWMTSVTNLNWDGVMSQLKLDPQRWDELMDLGAANVVQTILNASPSFFPPDPTRIDQLQIDLENAALAPAALRTQIWYPSGGTAEEMAAFEKKYYDGFALTQYSTVDAARQLGFKSLSVYGWNPSSVGWIGMPTYVADPAGEWYWQNVGLQVISHVDIVNNSVYCYYWDPANVAYTLARNDINLAFVNSLPPAQRKPVRPYFTNQLTGGGGGWRWWRNQPLATEEMRAMALLNAFTQYDGMVLWNWSGTVNDNVPPAIVTGADLMLADNAFSASQEGGGAHSFTRYDAVHILNADSSGNIQIQLLNMDSSHNYGVDPTLPTYDSTAAALTPHLRPPSEPLSGLFEGLALAKLLEWNLRNSRRVVDFDPQQVFAQVSPVSRHIKNGDLHILATYDPQVVYGKPARNLTISNFNGVSGLNLTLAADSQVRLYAVRIPAAIVGWWPFNEPYGGTAADISGYGNTGMILGQANWVAGLQGNALSFDGGSGAVTVNGTASTDNLFRSGMTLSAWIAPIDGGGAGHGRIVDKDNGSGGWFLSMAGDNGLQFVSRQAHSGSPTRSSASAIVTGAWQHIAVTWDGGASASNIHIYVGGSLADGSGSDGQLPNLPDKGIPLTIGNRSVDNAFGFHGSIEDVRIYNGVLTPAQIQAIASGS
jgi:Concanavalin A-like lectin/glucanases superfamily